MRYLFLSLSVLLAASSWADEKKSKLTPEQIKRGQQVYTMKGCAGCHSIGQGPLAGPDLKDVSERRKKEWLVGWMKNPDAYFEKKDPIAMEMLGKYFTKMPNLGLTDQEVEDVLAYIESESKKAGKK